jgi:voltage-gated sodium channel type X alpha
VFHFRAPGQDISFPDGITDDGVFSGDHESHRGSLLLGRGAGQQVPLPRSPLPQPPNLGSGHEEEGHPTLPMSELAPGATDVLVSLCMCLTLSDCLPATGLWPRSPVCCQWKGL